MSQTLTKSWLDGVPAEALPLDDRGVLYGESVFETMAVRDGTILLWRQHWQRLQQAVSALGWPPIDRSLIEAELAAALSPLGQAVVRLTLTGGSGGHGYWPPTPSTVRRIIQCRAWPERIEQARQQGLHCVRLLDHDAGPLCGHKHGNRLTQVLAARQAQSVGADEALVFDASGHLLEGISSNVIVVRDGRASTPEHPMVNGVGLGWLRAHCPNIKPQVLNMADLEQAEEVVMVNSVGGVRPVVRLDAQLLPIGPHCLKWQQLWRQHLV